MSDIPGFPPEETAKPPGKRELARRAREAKALQVWYRTLSEGEVRKELGLQNNEAARVLINRAVDRWHDEVVDHARRLRTYKDHMLLKAAMKLGERLDDGEMQRVPDLVKVLQEIGKLHDLDARPDVAGGQVLVIDTRPPWERDGDTIDGEVVEDGKPPKGLPG